MQLSLRMNRFGSIALALAMLLSLFTLSGCTDKEQEWQESEGVVRAFLEQLKRREYTNAHNHFKEGAGLGALSNKEFEEFISKYEDTGLLDFSYTIERLKSDSRAKLYEFRVKRTYDNGVDLSKAPVSDSDKRMAPLEGLSPYTDFVVQRFNKIGWRITSATTSREYDVGLGVREPDAEKKRKQE